MTAATAEFVVTNPKDDLNTTPVFYVSYFKFLCRKKPTTDAFNGARRESEARVFAANRLREGTLVSAHVRYCGGFAF
jgi:hypothetical protein